MMPLPHPSREHQRFPPARAEGIPGGGSSTDTEVARARLVVVFCCRTVSGSCRQCSDPLTGENGESGYRTFGVRMETAIQVEGKETQMIILGVVLLVVGLLVKGLAVLATIGVVVLVIGAILAILGGMGRAVGGRRHYY